MHFLQSTLSRWTERFMILLCSCSTLVSALPNEDGLYAVVNTSLGEFTVRLAFEKAPRTVANFASLAEGDKTWLDLKTGKIRNDRYYDQLTFHRIIPGFVIQGGSPNALGNDGPGYMFKDEFHPDLRHDKAGILSMANSGRHTNGSQFFVTLAPQPHLDDKHSVFGEVVEGMEQVFALGKDPVSAPTPGPVIETINILRIGEAAKVFGLESIAEPLPEIIPAQVSMARLPSGSIELHWTANASATEYLFASDNLVDWSGALLSPAGRISMDSFVSTREKVFVKIIQALGD